MVGSSNYNESINKATLYVIDSNDNTRFTRKLAESPRLQSLG